MIICLSALIVDGLFLPKLLCLTKQVYMVIMLRKICICVVFVEENPVLTTKQIKVCLDKVLKIIRPYGIKIETETISIDTISYKKFYKLGHSATNGLCYNFLDAKGNYSYSKIVVINGVPTIYFEEVLAHELFHALLYQKNIVLGNHTEGFCNIGSAIILDYYNINNNSKQARFLLNNLEKNPDLLYGKGYRELKTLLIKYGWKDFLAYIKTFKNI